MIGCSSLSSVHLRQGMLLHVSQYLDCCSSAFLPGPRYIPPCLTSLKQLLLSGVLDTMLQMHTDMAKLHSCLVSCSQSLCHHAVNIKLNGMVAGAPSRDAVAGQHNTQRTWYCGRGRPCGGPGGRRRKWCFILMHVKLTNLMPCLQSNAASEPLPNPRACMQSVFQVVH